MGLDGGTIVTRSDVLRGTSWALSQQDGTRSSRGGAVGTSKVYKKQQLDKISERRLKWTTCGLTGEPLRVPIVADWLGNLYSKESVLAFLLARAGSFADEDAVHLYANQLRLGAATFEHLVSLRDVFEVRWDTHNAEQPRASEDSGGSGGAIPVTCPVTSASCLRQPFVALPRCGHVFATKALEHIQGSCAVCGTLFEREEAVGLIGDEAEVARLQALLPGRRKSVKERGKKRRRDKESSLVTR